MVEYPIIESLNASMDNNPAEYSPGPSIPHTAKRCVVCGESMFFCVNGYYICNACGYMSSDLCPGSGAEVEGVAHVRIRNYILICNTIKKFFPSHTHILDVGCANGLFLKVAKNEGLNSVGLEPDFNNASKARAQCFKVIDGFFPDAVAGQSNTFDAVIFNDSFEHIPNSERVIQGLKQCLKKDGIVIVNAPSSKGLIFTLSFLMSKLGVTSPLDRLWQKGFSSPHLHYFNSENLRMLFEKHGFTRVRYIPLSYYTLDKLWTRIRCNTSFLKTLIVWPCLVLFYPFHILLKSRSDCAVSFFR